MKLGRSVRNRKPSILPGVLAAFLGWQVGFAGGTALAGQWVTGTYQGNDTDNRAITGLGFRPAVVIIKNEDNENAIIRSATMSGGVSKSLSEISLPFFDRIQSLDADGFTIGTSDDVNKLGVSYDFIAFAAAPGELAVGTYLGDGLDGHDVNGVGFQPAYLIVWPEAPSRPWQRTSAMSGDASTTFIDDPIVANRIQNLTADGFLLGSDFDVNMPGQIYHYVAWKAVAGATSVGSYAGDGTDDRDVTGLGYRPDWLVVKASGRHAVHRPVSAGPGDLTLPFRKENAFAHGIQQLLADGFQVGRDNRVNEEGTTYYYAGFAGPGPALDLELTQSADPSTANEGNLVTFEVAVTNAGPNDATGVVIADLLPAGLSFAFAQPSQGSYDDGTGLWTLGDLPIDDTVSLKLAAMVDTGTAGSLLPNVASVHSLDQPDLDGGNDSAAAAITVNAAAVHMMLATGSYPGNGSDNRSIGGLGFQPDVVLVKADASSPAFLRTATMSGDAAKALVEDSSPYTDRIQAFRSGGFVVGNDAAVNGIGTTYHWIAFRAAPGELRCGSFLGDGQDDRNVTGIGFQPDYVIVLTEDNGKAYQKSAAMAGDASMTFVGGLEANRLQALLPDGFQVSGDRHVNEAGSWSHYLAWKAVPGQVAFGAYVGDNADNRNILGLGFRPEYLVIGSDAGQPSAHRSASLGPADATLEFLPDPSYANGIQALLADGFQVGSAKPVNDGGKDIYWTAFADLTSADLEVGKIVDDPTPDEGRTITYTLTVKNAGPDAATGIRLFDLLPAGLGFVSAVPEQGTYDPGTGSWAMGDLDAGAGASLNITVMVDPGTAGQIITNTVSVASADQDDPDPDNNSASVAITVQSVDLEVAKSVDEPAPNEGDTVVYTVTLTNHGPDGGTGIAVTDALPAGVSFVSAAPSRGTYDQGSGIWSVGSLANGVSATLILTATVDAGTAGTTITNTAAVTAADQADPIQGNNSAAAGITVQSADLQVSKSVDNPTPNEGDTVVFTVSVTNNGPGAGTGIVVTDVLPAGVSFVSAAPSQGTYDDGTGLWSVGTLTAGLSATLNLTARVDTGVGGSTVTNTATITAADQADPVGANNAAAAGITVQSADLQVGKSVDDPTPNEGDTVVYTVTVTNNGPNAGTGIMVTDVLPAGVSFVSAVPSQGTYNDVTGLWSLGGLAAGLSATLNLTVQVQAGTGGSLITNTATITAADQVDPVAGNNSAAAGITVQSADLQVSKSVDQPSPNEGDLVQFTVVVTNAGPSDATGIQLTDLLPAGLTFVSAMPAQGTYDDGTGLWDVGALASATSATLVLNATVDVGTGGATITNTATITAADQADPAAANNSSSSGIGVESADEQVTKSVDDPSPNEGDTAVYTVTVTNNGPANGTGIVVTDLLPTGVSFVSAVPSQGAYDDGTGVWGVGDLASGTSAILTLSATVDAGTAGTTIANTAAITAADQADPDGSNDSAAADITVQSADLQVTKMVDEPGPNEGDTVVYTVTVTNGGPDAGTGIALTDVLPAGVSFVSAVPSQGTFNGGTGVWDVGDLAGGTGANLILTATVDPGTAGTVITNTAAISAADQADPDGSNNSAASDIMVQSADLQVDKGVDDPSPNEGDTVVYTVTVTNEGPNGGTGIAIADALPAGVSFVSAAASRGTYDEGTGNWNVGTLASGVSATLLLTATVDAGTAGTTIINTAVVAAADQVDPDGGNNSDSADITVQSADLQIAKSVDNPLPNERDTVIYTVTVTNNGPQAGTGVEIMDILPAGLNFVSAALSRGTYDEDTGIWSLGSLASGASATLLLSARVRTGTAATIITNSAAVSAVDQADPVPGNDSAAVEITVQGVDLQVAKTVDRPSAVEGDLVVFTVNVLNNGPQTGTGIELTDALPAGMSLVSATPNRGSYDADTGAWHVGGLPREVGATLVLRATVDAGTAGTTLVNIAAVSAADQGDPDNSNNADSAGVTVTRLAGRILVRVVPEEPRPLRPGGPPDLALDLEIVNDSVYPDTLRSLSLTNVTQGPGSQAQLDADWESLEFLARSTGFGPEPGNVGETAPATAVFADGRLTFEDLRLGVAPGDTVHLQVRGRASLGARDGDELAVAVERAADLAFGQPVVVVGESGPIEPAADWPLPGERVLLVDGFVAEQLHLEPVPAGVFPVGSMRNLALDVALPPNGYVGDTLERLNVVSAGTALSQLDIAKVEAWTEMDGVDGFDPSGDLWLGTMAFTGNRWELTGLSHEVPLAGLRIYFTVDIAQTATAGRTLRLGLPTLPDVAIGMASGNDGPIDRAVYNPSAQSVSEADRLILSAGPVPGGTVRPGAAGVPLLHLAGANTYADARVLTGLTVTNATTSGAGGGQAERDGAFELLRLWWDANEDGVLSTGDLQLGVAGFDVGLAEFSGFAVTFLPDQTHHLFLTGQVSRLDVADTDVLAAVVADGLDLQFTEATAAVAAWPLDSGARWTVDGMVALQLGVQPVPPVALTAGDGPILALDVTVPANGYAADVLNGVRLVNLGTAADTDLQGIALWADGGDTLFDAGAGDDLSLGSCTWQDTTWVSSALAVPLPAGGLRLFAGLTVSLTPTDSATVRLAIPQDGLTVGSGNDGPVDAAVGNPNALLLSTAPLLATLETSLPRSTVGQVVTVRMLVRNVGGEDVLGVTPSLLAAQGDGTLSYLSGPSPASFDLPFGQTGTFTWTYHADAVGTVLLTGSSEGTGAVGGLPRRSLPATSNMHAIRLPVSSLELFAGANMPFSINRGQIGVVPLTLTFANQPGGADVAEANLVSLRMRLEDEGGGDIVPADLLSRVVVGEGANIYLSRTELETSGSEVDLTLEQPAAITGSEPVSLAIRLDIAADTLVPAFRVTILDSLWFAATDVINGQSVPVVLQGAAYPIASGLGRLVAEATELAVAPVPAAPVAAGRGQVDVPLLTLRLENPGVESLSSDIAVGSLSVGLTDTLGAPQAQPARLLQRIRAAGPFQVLTDRTLHAGDDTTLTLFLSPPLTVPVNTPVELQIRGDVAEDADLGAFRLALGDTSLLDARDGNTGTAVPVHYEPPLIQGTVIRVEAPASLLVAAGVPRLPVSLGIGSRSVPALELILQHGGTPEEAAIRCDSLRFLFLDAARLPYEPATVLDRLQILWGAVPVGVLTDPAAPDGVLSVPLSDLQLAVGRSETLSVVLDVEASAPAVGFELLLPEGSLLATDANLGSPVDVDPAPGRTFPFSSGLTHLHTPADELVVDFTSLLPAVLAADGRETAACVLSLTNPAAPEMGGITLQQLVLRGATAEGTSLPLGAAAAEVRVYHAGELWAASGALSGADSVAVVVPAEPLIVPAGGAVDLQVRAVFQAGTTVPGLRLGLLADDISIEQPGGALLTIRVEPAAGKVFPFWTDAGHFAPLDLAASYANFPNPFAAGREKTRFVYALQGEARVSLRILTVRGETVIMLLDRAPRGAGLHQDDAWDGRNGRESVVHNGVYVAELVVRYDSGAEHKLRRKVAVVR